MSTPMLSRSRTVSRRTFTAALVGIPFALRAQPSALAARIKVSTDRGIAPIDPKVYGNFAEHLGRCIEGGIFEEKSSLSDHQGYRKDVMEAIRNLHVTQMRWPGGNFSSNYHWMDGIGPRDQRPKRLDMAWHTIEDNRFGTHEFLNYSELMGFEPYVCANFGTGSWVEAQQWLEYTNFAGDTAMTELRRKNGREKPWKVTYWGLGNEMDGPWQMGHRSADDYGKFALEGAKLMKWTDPSVKLVAAGSSNFRPEADWTGWNRTVLQHLRDHCDYLSLHTYVGNTENDYYKFLASSVELNDRIKIAEGIIRAVTAGSRRQHPIYIAFDEWNVWYRERGAAKESGRRILEERYNLEDALVVATMLNTFVNNAQIIKMANMAQIVNVIAPIFTNEKGLFLQTIYYPLQLFAANTHGTALEALVECQTYDTAAVKSVPYLDVSAAEDNGTIVFNVVNRHLDRDIEAEIECTNRPISGRVETTVVNGPEIKSQNDFGSTTVRAETGGESAASGKLRFRFPAHSYTMLKGKLA